MPTLRQLLALQVTYAVLGVLYNLGSLYALEQGQPAWSVTDPVFGLASMSVYGLLLTTAAYRDIRLYRGCMLVAVVLMGYGGVATHLLNWPHLEGYQSVWTWLLAIVVNGYGLTLNAVAAIGRFQSGAGR